MRFHFLESRKIFLFPAIAVALCGWMPGTASADLVASYQFEEGADGATATGANSILDSSGNGLHGTPINGPVYREIGGSLAMEFNGSDDRIFVGDDPLFEITQSLTLEATIRVDAITGSQQRIIFRGDSLPGLEPYELNIRGDGRLRFAIKDDQDNQARVLSPNAVPVGQLIHVAGTLDDATGEMNLYLNRQRVATLTTNLRPFGQLDQSQNPGLGIGSRQDGSDDYFGGLIDDVRIYSTVVAIPEPSGVGLCLASLLAIAAGRKRY